MWVRIKGHVVNGIYMQKVTSVRDEMNATDGKIGLHGLSEK